MRDPSRAPAGMRASMRRVPCASLNSSTRVVPVAASSTVIVMSCSISRPADGPRVRRAAGFAVALIVAPARAQLVVEPALLGIGEDLVGLGDLLEARLGLAVAGI